MFRERLQDLGWTTGTNAEFVVRGAEGHPERFPSLASELVQQNPDVILAVSAQAVQALQQTRTTIPVVFVNVSDPVSYGFVASLARPGGTMTGLSHISAELAGRRLQLLKEIVPGTRRVAALATPVTPPFHWNAMKAAAAARP